MQLRYSAVFGVFLILIAIASQIKATTILTVFGNESNTTSTDTDDCFEAANNQLVGHVLRQWPRSNRVADKSLFFAILFYDDPFDELRHRVTINAAIDVAVRHVQAAGGLLAGFNITTEYRDSRSSSLHGALAAWDLHYKRQPDAFFGPMEEYTLAPVARYCSAWESPILTPGGMSVAFRQKHDELEGFTTLTRMLGSYAQMGYAIHGILQQFNWRTAYIVYHSSEVHSDCVFRMEVIVPHIEVTDTQTDLIERFDETVATRADYRAIMDRAKRNSRRKSSAALERGIVV